MLQSLLEHTSANCYIPVWNKVSIVQWLTELFLFKEVNLYVFVEEQVFLAMVTTNNSVEEKTLTGQHQSDTSWKQQKVHFQAKINKNDTN